MSVWVMPSVIDVYENFLKRSQAVAGGRRRWAHPVFGGSIDLPPLLKPRLPLVKVKCVLQ